MRAVRAKLVCPQCSKHFVQRSAHPQRFCSRACHYLSRRFPRTPCLRCGAEIHDDGRPSQRYCSLTCAYADRTFRIKPKCPICGTEVGYASKACNKHKFAMAQKARERRCAECERPFTRPPSTFRRQATIYCSRSCWKVSAARRPALLDINCEWCGKGFKRTRAAIARETHSFCSKRCAGAFNSGPNNRTWRGGIRGWRGMGWERARKAARARDQVCRLCGKTPKENGQRLSVDHIVPYGTFDDPEKANDLSNLVSLCRSCHAKKTHGPEYHFLNGNVEYLDQWRAQVAVNA